MVPELSKSQLHDEKRVLGLTVSLGGLLDMAFSSVQWDNSLLSCPSGLLWEHMGKNVRMLFVIDKMITLQISQQTLNPDPAPPQTLCWALGSRG